MEVQQQMDGGVQSWRWAGGQCGAERQWQQLQNGWEGLHPLGSKGFQPQPRVQVPRRYISITSGYNKQWGVGKQKKLPDFHHLKGQQSLKNFANPPTLGLTIGTSAGRAPVTHRKGVK